MKDQNEKPFYHEHIKIDGKDLSQSDALKECVTWGDVMEKFKQPDWCGYHEALAGQYGCWSLVKGFVTGIDFCKDCECYSDKNKTAQ